MVFVDLSASSRLPKVSEGFLASGLCRAFAAFGSLWWFALRVRLGFGSQGL